MTSNRATAAIINALFKDAGLIHSKNTEFVVDGSKIRRARVKAGNSAFNNQCRDVSIITSIYFNGKKMKTLVKELVCTDKSIDKRKNVNSSVSLLKTINKNQEHYVILA